MTLGTLIDDVFLRVYKSSPSDDTALERAQVKHWLQIVRDELVKTYLDDLIKNGRPIDTFYIEREVGKFSDAEVTVEVPDEDERIYFNLTKQPMSLFNDSGVVKVTTSEGVKILKTRLELLEVINDLKYATPSPKNLVWYRDNLKIIVEGLSDKNLDETTFIVFYVPTSSSQTLAETDDLKIHGEAIPTLLDQVEQIALRELQGVSDTENNGVEAK